MKIHVIIAQRKCRHEGQYGLECLGGASEYEYDTDPDPLDGELKKFRAGGLFDAVEIVTLEASEQAIRAVLYPARQPIPASVWRPATESGVRRG